MNSILEADIVKILFLRSKYNQDSFFLLEVHVKINDYLDVRFFILLCVFVCA